MVFYLAIVIAALVSSGACWWCCFHCLQGLSEVTGQVLRGELHHQVALALEVERIVMAVAWGLAGQKLFGISSNVLDKAVSDD